MFISIHHYLSAPSSSRKGVCTVGTGGVGKTTATQMALLQGKETTWSSTPAQLAERAIAQLYRNPEKLELLRTCDVLFLDEAGNVQAEIGSVMDIVLRYIRKSNRPYGGMLILCTMDNLQIDRCKERHPLLSSLFTTSFLFFRLHACVRAADDAPWKCIQEILLVHF